MTADDVTVATLDNNLDDALHYFDDEFHRYLETGASTFDLSILKRLKIYSNANTGNETDYQHLKENNSLVFTHKNRDYKFTIRRIEETESSMRLYCENLSLDLINEYRAPYKADKAYGIAKYINDCIYDSGYEIGINEFSSNVRTLEWESDQTVLARMLSICNSFGAEIEFETILNSDRSVKKNYVHLKKQVGENRQDIELKYGREVTSIGKTVDINDLITCIAPTGSEKDGKKTTIKNIEREIKNNEGVVEFFTKKGSDTIYAPLANNVYGFRRKNDSKGYVKGMFDYDTESDSELFNRALTELKKRCVPRYEFEIEGYYDVNVGDTVRAMDEAYNPILMLEARISEQIISFSDSSRNKTVYSNYKVLENKVNQSLLDRVNQLAALANQLKYGIDFEGSTVFKNGQGSLKLYADVMRGELHVADEFTSFNWIKKNSDGTIDEVWTQAHTGVGKVIEILPSDVNEGATFSFTVLVNEEQQGNATIVVSNVYDGKDGSDGKDGNNGKDGLDGKDTYVHKAWSWSADGTDRFTDKYPNENLIVREKTESYTPYNGSITFDSKGTLKTIVAGANPANYFTISLKDTVPTGIHTLTGVIKYDGVPLKKSDFISWRANTYNAHENSNVFQVSDDGTFRITENWNRSTKWIFHTQMNINLEQGKIIEIENFKFEKLSEPTIYTPSPKDDFNNAWPKYEGYYSSHSPVQSTNPSDYTWSVIRGENGKDGTDGKNGTDGKDGVTPKDVISGYLSNESIIVPATPTGAVTDLSKAFGDFVVFEGQTKKTSGVTYSKVSEVGMTSSINSNGRYVVSALSADTGTATYRATYSGVTIDKIIIVVKNKQGQSGADGKDGQQGIQGVPGKDGSNGKDGATGPQGPPTGITTSASVPTNPYVGMLWQNTGDIPGYITGVTYQWNGARWNIFIFSAENIVANSLSAISANLGTITAGEILTSFFRGDSISSAIKKRGTTTISNGQFKSSFDYVQVTNNTILGKGDVVLDENGFMVRDLTASGEVLRSTAYNPEGVFMFDANINFGTVNLKYQDLMSIEPTRLQAEMGFKIYGTSDSSEPAASRDGRMVTLTGAFTNLSSIRSSTTKLVMGYVPEWAKPKRRHITRATGSGFNSYSLEISDEGAIEFSRYGTDGMNIPAGSWFGISTVYSAADIV